MAFPVRLQPASDDAFGLAACVAVARVDEVDAGLDSRIEDGFRFDLRSGIGEVIRAERQGRDLEAGSTAEPALRDHPNCRLEKCNG